MDYFRRGVEVLNPGLAFFLLSCKTGQGLEAWLGWVRREVAAYCGDEGVDYEVR
jgi:hydrogenase nickel incorporation protein HypB